VLMVGRVGFCQEASTMQTCIHHRGVSSFESPIRAISRTMLARKEAGEVEISVASSALHVLKHSLANGPLSKRRQG
jgi:hypothetical protein